MIKVKPYPIVGKKDAERLGISPLTGVPRPDFQFDEASIRLACRRAGLPDATTEKIVKLAYRFSSDYVIERRTDALSANATEARELASRLESAAADIRDVLNRRLASPFITADIQQSLAHVARAAAALRRQAGKPARGGGTQAKAKAKVRLAKELLQGFAAHDWPMGTGPKSLMAEVLRICLEGGGTPHAHSHRILAAAKKQLHD